MELLLASGVCVLVEESDGRYVKNRNKLRTNPINFSYVYINGFF